MEEKYRDVELYDGEDWVNDPQPVLEMFQQENAAFFERNRIMHRGPYVSMMPEEETEWPAWLSEMTKALPNGRGVDARMRTFMSVSARPLQFVDAEAPEFRGLGAAANTPKNVLDRFSTTIDMSKCYYHALRLLLDDPHLIPVPNLFSQFEEFTDGPKLARPGELVDYWYYRIARTPGDCLEKWGLQTDVMLGFLLDTCCENLFYSGLTQPINILAILKASPPSTDYLAQYKKAANVLRTQASSDPQRQKEIRLLIGLCGRLKKTTVTRFQLDPQFEDEEEWYVDTYGATRWSEEILEITDTRHVVNGRLPLYTAVVNMANNLVLKALIRIRQRGPRPLVITTDALTYRIDDIKTPFHPNGDTNTLLRLAYDGCGCSWKIEPQADKPNEVTLGNVYRSRFSDAWHNDPSYGAYAKNTVYVGAPGTGKTWQAINVHEVDIAATNTNRGARRLKEAGVADSRTLYRLFNVIPGVFSKVPSYKRLSGKTVLIDEAQSIKRHMWPYIQEACESYNVRFVFTMDPNQLPPIGEPPLSIIPLMGEVIELTTDHRNDRSLVKARNDVLECGDMRCLPWSPPAHTLDLSDIPDDDLDDVNIAFTNSTCQVVNERVRRKYNLVFGVGQTGRYVVKDSETRARKTRKLKYGLLTSEFLTKAGHERWLRADGSEVRPPITIADAGKILEWGWCTTIHKQIGETINDSFTIWDCDLFDKHLAYTAVTRGRSIHHITFRARPPSRWELEHQQSVGSPDQSEPPHQPSSEASAEVPCKS